MNKPKSTIVLIALVFLVGGGAFFLGQNAKTIKKITEIRSFIKKLPNTNPDYLGEIISKDGNLITIKYFEKSASPLSKFTDRESVIKFLRKLSTEEKIAIGEELKQKVSGTSTVLVPLGTPIYVKKGSPELINFTELKNGDFIVVWGTLNEKGQITSDFILTANPKNYE